MTTESTGAAWPEPVGHATADGDSLPWRRILLLSALPMAMVAIVGGYRLGSRALSLDETTSYYLTRIDWGRFIEVVADSKTNMSLYFTMLRLWPLTGDEAALRALSVLFGVLTVPPFVALARRIMPDWAAAAAAIVLAANALYLFELRDARGYSLVVLLVVLGTWLLVMAAESRRGWAWIAWGATMALSLFAHFFAAFVLLAHLLALAWTRPTIPRSSAIAAAVLLAAAILPIGVTVLTQGGTTLGFVLPTTWERLWDALIALAASVPALVVYAAGIAFGFAALWRRTGESPNRSRLAWLLVLLAGVLPVLLIVLLSLVKPVLVNRYLLIALPFVILAAIGALVATSRPLGLAAIALLIVVSAVPTVATLRGTPDNPPSWVAYVIKRAEPGDGVFFVEAQYRKVFAYYLPAELTEALAQATSDAPVHHNPYEPWPPSDVSFRERLEAMACRHDRVWLIGGPANLERAKTSRLQAVAMALTDAYTELDARRFGNRWVRLWERDAAVDCA